MNALREYLICFLTAWEPLVSFRSGRLPAARHRRELHGMAPAGPQRPGRHRERVRGRRLSRLLRPRLNDVPARLPTRCREVNRVGGCRRLVVLPARVPAVAAQKRALALLRLLVRLVRPDTTARLPTRRRTAARVRRLLRLLPRVRLHRPPPATTTRIVQRPFCLRVRLQRPPPATTCRILPQR